MICGRSGRIRYRTSRRGMAKVTLALCRRSKPTDVQKQSVPRETTLQNADDLPVTCRCAQFLTDIEVAQTPSEARGYRPSVNGSAENRMFHVEHGLCKATDGLWTSMRTRNAAFSMSSIGK